jgi:hypothetical protein
VGMLDDGEVRQRLGYHPATEATTPAFEMNRSAAILLGEVWNRTLPPGREAALALTALQEALMWANAAVACRAGDDWQLEPIDVSELLDDLAERLEGPLHLRSRVVGSGGPVSSSNGGDIGPEDGSGGPAGPDSAEIVPDEGITGTSLDDDAAQQLIERTGSLGPADDIARR